MAANGNNRSGFFVRHRWLLWAVGIVGAVVLLASFMSHDDAVPIRSATVQPGTIRSIVSTNGKVEPLQSFEAHAPVGTTVKKLLVREGDHVNQGQIMVQVDDADARSQAAKALAQIRSSEADVSAIQSGGNREEDLTLEGQLAKTHTQREAAPRYAVGEANAGDLILQEDDLSKVLVRSFVDEPDVCRLAPGQKIEITWDAVHGRIWTGALNTVPASVKLRGTRNVGETTCVVDNKDFKLLPNINVGVTIVTAEHHDVLTVPREAVRQEDSKVYVLQVVNNELHRRDVQTSISNLTQVEITGGIPANSLVALASINSKPLHDGLAVKVVH